MHEVDAVKTIEQRRQIEAHLSERGQIYADIWKVGVNTVRRQLSWPASVKIVDARQCIACQVGHVLGSAMAPFWSTISDRT